MSEHRQEGAGNGAPAVAGGAVDRGGGAGAVVAVAGGDGAAEAVAVVADQACRAGALGHDGALLRGLRFGEG
ncbi:hypothetical protein GCM10009759_39430 [Kitasatospora saccharophila]|uniref:Uncharacterized protein n=1 Tax=Kitasatospora saccharophila TaxID=407973 RepID=A0ABN2X4V8_9ACTN